MKSHSVRKLSIISLCFDDVKIIDGFDTLNACRSSSKGGKKKVKKNFKIYFSAERLRGSTYILFVRVEGNSTRLVYKIVALKL